MGVAQWIYKFLNEILTAFTVVALVFWGSYAVYALWDNQQVYAEADILREEMLQWKPVASDQENGGASFEQLVKINPDVCGWLTMDETKIDFPILQGVSNLIYLNTDVYGEFSLAGSIFLDSRNHRDFTDPYHVLYGHHMANHNMFGDLDLYKDPAFFEENGTGKLILPDRTYDLEVYACLVAQSSDDVLFEPDLWQSDLDKVMTYIEQNALLIHQDVLADMEHMQTLAMSTCSSEFTDARTIVLARMIPKTTTEQEGTV